MMAWVDGTGDAPEVVRTFNFRPEALQEIRSRHGINLAAEGGDVIPWGYERP
jgi:hypothetical protein